MKTSAKVQGGPHLEIGSFSDRTDAGNRLGQFLKKRGIKPDLVLGIARGGIPVAAEVARLLQAPLDVLLVRKVGAPENPEFGIGAVSEDLEPLLNREAIQLLGLRPDEIDDRVVHAQSSLKLRREKFRQSSLDVRDRTVLVIDDGLATGVSAAAGCKFLKRSSARKVILAVPVAAKESLTGFRQLCPECSEIIALHTPDPFFAVGSWYDDFTQVEDEDVLALLKNKNPEKQEEGQAIRVEVAAGLERVELEGSLTFPKGRETRGLVVFAHGSGSSRFSSRNVHVAQVLREKGFATLLIDLLSPVEAVDRDRVFDIDLLAQRLDSIVASIYLHSELRDLPLAYFGASTGAAAALKAAARQSLPPVAAVVSRGGRPDLVMEKLRNVRAATRLIVGSKDHAVLRLNQQALKRLSFCESDLQIVPGASHLFEEPGTLDEAAELAAEWFVSHLPAKKVTRAA